METAQHNGSRESCNPAQFRKLNIVSSKIPPTISIFFPKFAKISLAFSGVFSNGMIWNFISGQCSCIFGHICISSCAGVIGEDPMRIMFVSSCMAFFARVTESLQYWIIYFVSWYKDFPAFVRVSPLCVLSNNFTSKEFPTD